MGKKYLLFDNDGVLVETEFWYFKATQRALANMGVLLSHETYQTLMPSGKGCWHLASEAGITDAEIALEKQNRDTYYAHHLSTEMLDIAGVEQTLRQLSKHFRMAVVTTSYKSNFELIHKQRPMLQYMDFVLAHGDYARAKPQPDPYLKALAKFNAKPEEALVIEDSERGLQSAVAANIDCAVVHNDFTKGQDFSKAKHRIQKLGDLIQLLKPL